MTHQRPDDRHEGDLRCFGLPTILTIPHGHNTVELQRRLTERLQRHRRPGAAALNRLRLVRTDASGILPERMADEDEEDKAVMENQDGELAWWGCVWDDAMKNAYHEESMALEAPYIYICIGPWPWRRP